jgi:retron-type reverse transcriptase
MKLVLEPIFEADFHDCSYGYRPKRDAKQASKAIRDGCNSHIDDRCFIYVGLRQ